MVRRGLLFLAVLAATAVAASGAAGKRWPSLEFKPSAAKPGDIVTARISLTPSGYVAPPRPGGPRIEIVLVPARIARTVNSADEDAVVHVATIHADLNWRGTTRFRLPDVPAGQYVGAYSIAGSFHAPRSVRPFDLKGFRLRVIDDPGVATPQLLGLFVGLAGAAGIGALLVWRRSPRLVLPASR